MRATDTKEPVFSYPGQVSFPFSGMLCGSVACTKGRFKVAAFGALSRFDGAMPAANFVPADTFKLGRQVVISDATLTSLPEIFYGEPAGWHT